MNNQTYIIFRLNFFHITINKTQNLNSFHSNPKHILLKEIIHQSKHLFIKIRNNHPSIIQLKEILYKIFYLEQTRKNLNH